MCLLIWIGWVRIVSFQEKETVLNQAYELSNCFCKIYRKPVNETGIVSYPSLSSNTVLGYGYIPLPASIEECYQNQT